jgi:hypothetical protein
MFDAQIFSSDLPLFVGWIDLGGGNDPAGGGEHKKGATTAHGRTVNIPECRMWYVEPRHDLPKWTWGEVLAEIDAKRLPGLSAGYFIADDTLKEVSKLNHLKYLDLTRCQDITDVGLTHLSNLTSLESIYLGNCKKITDSGLSALSGMFNLKTVRLTGLPHISDQGLRYLANHQDLELVTLTRSPVGDDALRTLSHKPRLTHLAPSDGTTDRGLALLPSFPGLKIWKKDRPKHQINEYAAPTPSNLHLDLRGQMPVTDNGLKHLAHLNGVFELGIPHQHSSRRVTSAVAEFVSKMQNVRTLRWAEHICDDTALQYFGKMPVLASFLSFGSPATDVGFEALSQCHTLREIAARGDRITKKALISLSKLPNLTQLHLGGPLLDDDSLDVLPKFPSLKMLWPTFFGDEAYKHIGQISTLESLTNMYCQGTADKATQYIRGLPLLKSYKVWTTRITDRSLTWLSQMDSLEALLFQKCHHISDSGVAQLARLPNLRTLNLQKCEGLTDACAQNFRPEIGINFQDAPRPSAAESQA